jgi:hypothetical protein
MMLWMGGAGEALLNVGMILGQISSRQGRFAKRPYKIHASDQQRRWRWLGATIYTLKRFLRNKIPVRVGLAITTIKGFPLI